MMVEEFFEASWNGTRLRIAFSSDTSEPVGTALFSSTFNQRAPTGPAGWLEITLVMTILEMKYCLNTAAHLAKLSRRETGSKEALEAMLPAESDELK